MIEGDTAIYKRIAGAMTEAIPEPWTSAKFEARFFPDGSVYEAEYVRKQDGKARSFLPADDGDRAFRELRKQFRASRRPVFGRACFELRPDGTFDMKWGYDDCDGNGDLLLDTEREFRRREERRKRLAEP